LLYGQRDGDATEMAPGVPAPASPAWQMLRPANGRPAGRAAGSDDAESWDPDLGTWLQERVLVTAKHHLINIVSLLAPFLVGPLGSLLSGIAGG
jgi:hypothetical protein